MISNNRTKSVYEVRRWVGIWAVMILLEGRIDNPSFCDMNGVLVRSNDVNDEFIR